MLIGLCLGMGSCVKDEREPTPEPTRVLLVYVGVDNNGLAGLENAKLVGMRDGWTGRPTDRIFAYVDKTGAGANLYELSVGKKSEPLLIENYGRENSASPATLARVIDKIRSEYKPDSYGLLVFTHGSGWLPADALDNPEKFNNGSLSMASALSEGGVATDNFQNSPSAETVGQSHRSRSIIIDGNSQMELADFAAAIPDGCFDYIVFEACFMAGIEVAWELRNKTPLILASSAEIVHPGFEAVYSSAIGQLLNQNLAGFGESVFRNTLTYCEETIQRSATYSVIRTAGLPALAAFIKANRDFSQEVDISQIQHFDRKSYNLFFDFEDYHGRLLSNDMKREELSRLISDCIEWKASTDVFMTQQPGYNGFTIRRHSGLTCYIPQKEFSDLNERYKDTEWTKATREK